MTLSPDFVAELRKSFRGDIRLDQTSRILYSTDASVYKIEPLGAVLPMDQEDLIAVVELAAKYKIPILPRGSGSSLAGQAIGHALILDCSRYLDKFPTPIDVENQTAIVEPGVILANLNRAAARHGLMFGPDPASAERATMGGVIGNNATGAHSILYGMTADHIVSADVILSDGSLANWGPVSAAQNYASGRQADVLATALHIQSRYEASIRESWPKTWRNSAGYRLNYLLPWSASQPYQWVGDDYPPRDPGVNFNLACLLAGSEGTLAVIRSAKVRLVPKPLFTVLGVLSFDSIAEACDAVPDLLRSNPSAVELVPQMLIRLARSVPAYASKLGFVRGDPAALLVVEYSGNNPNILRQSAQTLGRDVLIAETLADQANVWAVRKVGLGIFDSKPSADRPVAFIEDCAIPVERLGEFVREVEKILGFYETEAAFYAHASAGCLHIRPILNLKRTEGVQAFRSIAQAVLALTLRVGGSMSSEHGDGLVRGEWLKKTYGEEIVGAMKELKAAADPFSLLNPEKMTSAPVMDTNLRYGKDYKSTGWPEKLDFSRSGGLSVAIEQCNGQGVCRKQDGVMCPSFQATREEINSTRGRANLLRTFISVGEQGVKEEAVKQALDLCLACKGCKAECPSGVDMARLKYEFQSHYYVTHRRLLRDYLFGYIGVFVQMGVQFRPIVNWMTGLTIFRKIAKRYLGISDKRKFPSFGSIDMEESEEISGIIQNSQVKRYIEACLFLPDSFTHFFEPEVEQAALQVLNICGIDIKTIPVFGAGRTLLSKGFIDPARRHAENLLNKIAKMDPSGRLAVIGLEPSEIYTLRDEMLILLPERADEIRSLMERSWLIDEYLIRNNRIPETLRIAARRASLSGSAETVLLHGHCYQKAQPPNSDGMPVGLNASTELLRTVGYTVDVLNTGCCGMAGAFGYEVEHCDLSMQVGELKLFPELRSKTAKSGVTVAATGTSCRSQISDGTGIKARHSVVLVLQKLKAALESDRMKE
ncbi:MAG: FAD-linked oxidase C-terminal domain-containing protein [Chloroflexota bacterium]